MGRAMSKIRKTKPYIEIDRDSYDYDRLIDGIDQVIQFHFTTYPEFDTRQSAIKLVDTYEEIMIVFWSKEEVQIVLDELKRSLAIIASAYENIPTLVAEDLEMNATVCDDLRYDKFLNTTNLNFVTADVKPERNASIAVKALKPLATHYSGLVEAIEMTRRELPTGIATTNRQSFNQWALVHATVLLAREHSTMNIPNSMDQSGPLYKLLKDVFDVFGIKKTSFKRTYESWAKYIDGNLKNYDLASI